MNILLLGSGGREHALAWKIAQSEQVDNLYIAPGNAGTAGMTMANGSLSSNVAIKADDFEAIKAFAVDNNIDMVVVGPEDPLVKGIYDEMQSDPKTAHIPVIGPSKAGAQMEGSKDFAKAFMQRHSIPTARYQTFDGEHLAEGIAFLETLQPPYVLKADGLCAGKGVLILPTLDEAKQELKEVEARYNSLHKDNPVDMFGRLYTHYAWIGRELNDLFNGWDSNPLWYIVPSVLFLLFVPAVNLSGMVASRMERRLPEMAVRKAFGAKRRTLLWQVVVENLVLTIIGGIAGLCIAWMALYGWRDWVFVIFAYGATTYNAVPILKGEMFFGPAIFAIALLVCCVLNVLAATLPAWLSLRKPIVESMMLRK